jgi:hypothetical protein
MTDARRPLQTTPLGVPDFGWLNARAQAAFVLIANTKWVTVPTVAVTTAGVTAATIPMVATTTGRFRARLTGYVANTSAVTLAEITPAIGHGATLSYTQSPLNVPPSTGEALNTATVALIVDLPLNGFTAAVGSTTNIIANLVASANGLLVIATNAMQFEVQEY